MRRYNGSAAQSLGNAVHWNHGNVIAGFSDK
jgi:hypothetical protein